MVQSEEKQTIVRVTSIQFNRMQDLVNFMQEHGIEIREVKSNKYYKAGNERINFEETRHFLKKFGIPVETVYEWYTDVKTYSCASDIREKFDMSAEIKLYNYSIEIKTHNKTKFEQKKEVRKLYIPLKKAGIPVNYNCETEITSDNCKKLRG